MKNIYNLAELKELISKIKSDPRGDYDDELFNIFLNYSAFSKVGELKNKVIKDGERKYIDIGLDPSDEVRTISFYNLFLAFLSDFVDYDGFALGGIVIEKGFIEEIVSALDTQALCIIKGDITSFEGDAIVNAANNELKGGSGVDGAIHTKAGVALDEELREIGWCETGKAVMTGAYGLECDYVIHTVGPIYKGENITDDEALASCYTSALNLAKENGFRAIAFPVISSGAYGYPFMKAFEIGKLAIDDFFSDNPMYPILVFYYIYNEDDYNRILEMDN